MKNARACFTVAALLVVALLIANAGAGSLDPTNAPGPTMHTLEEIYQKVSMLAEPEQLSPTTTVVRAGYYEETTLDAVDADLITDNIKAGETLFGVTGKTEVVDTSSGTAVASDIREGAKAWVDGVELIGTSLDWQLPRTGQTNSYEGADDGDLQKGRAWPDPRFTVGSGAETNCVTDNLTGLMWPISPPGAAQWSVALAYCTNFTHGGHSDWRPPNLRELQSLIDYGRSSPALPVGHPFNVTAVEKCWTSTSLYGGSHAWYVNLPDGHVHLSTKPNAWVIWPVRDAE